MASYKSKGSVRSQHGGRSTAGRVVDESDGLQKPLAATLIQEFQNLKDKFKEDDEYDRGVCLYVFPEFSPWGKTYVHF